MMPYPVPPITSDARTPATRPTTSQATKLMVSVLERLLKAYGTARQIVASAEASLLTKIPLTLRNTSQSFVRLNTIGCADHPAHRTYQCREKLLSAGTKKERR
jgi:hypothetical protein